MKKVIVTILVLLAVGAVAVVTCPDKQAHEDAIQNVLNEKINEELNVSEGDSGLSALGAKLGSSLSGWLLDKSLNVENHFVYSVGKVDLGKGPKQVSVGVFGHVFTVSKDDIDDVLKDK